eukprot:16006888-Heterocapsa_arctica.AAC.1
MWDLRVKKSADLITPGLGGVAFDTHAKSATCLITTVPLMESSLPPTLHLRPVSRDGAFMSVALEQKQVQWNWHAIQKQPARRDVGTFSM